MNNINENTLTIEIPKGFMNVGISICNHLIADTNDSSNWDTIKFPLPKGKWNILKVEGKIVTLYITPEEFRNIQLESILL